MLTTLSERVDPRHAALLVLDMVKARPDAPPSVEIPRVRGPLSRLIRLIASGRRVGLRTIFVKNAYSDWLVLENWKEAWSRRPERSPLTYTEETSGIDLHDGLAPTEGDAVILKRYYSAFAHGPLDLMLRSKRIKSLLLTGGAVLGAVESAAKECYVRGYYLVLVSDGVVPDSGPEHEIVMRHGASRLGAFVATSDEIIEAWDGLAEKRR